MKKEIIRKVSNNTNVRGIHKHSNTGRYESRFSYKGQNTYLGSYKTIGEAITARVKFITTLM